MKKIKIQDIRKKNPEELGKMLDELREKVRMMRFKITGSATKNPHELQGTRKDIARVLTILKEQSHGKGR